MFAKTQMGGLDFAIPDVCLTPVPTPYPNLALPMTAIPTQFNVMTVCMPNHNLATITPMSNGDNGGVMGNPLSGMDMGPSKNLVGSFTTLIGGMPATTMLKPSGQNGLSPGAFGMSMLPSQVSLMILS